ncbi:hypothetical protein DICVIV_09954 [Dictyocaulus viviparus]|uniref:Uncharacterized protein n=1 Tax=Dictyocaulus viviparus TaxID=29172 RepID=A0A0D8XJK8_DICVI|nr:hypothetical protein DICVIV_09954 [Dictyocaulus viviparus]
MRLSLGVDRFSPRDNQKPVDEFLQELRKKKCKIIPGQYHRDKPALPVPGASGTEHGFVAK